MNPKMKTFVLNLNIVFIFFAFHCPLFSSITRPISADLRVHIKNNYGAISRRYENQFSLAETLLHSISSKGPKRGPGYDPSVGYEPYWPGGQWVFSAVPNRTTDGPPGRMCGQECSLVYKSYGVVCGRNKNFEHKTFKDYCELFNEDCSLHMGWLIAYRGPCQGALKTFPTLSALVASRAASYVSAFEARTRAPDRDQLEKEILELYKITKKQR